MRVANHGNGAIASLARRVPPALRCRSMRAEELRKTPVPELHRLFVEEARDLPCGGLTALKSDPRAGARAVAGRIEERNHEAQAGGRRLARLCVFEAPLLGQGLTLVCGCDD